MRKTSRNSRKRLRDSELLEHLVKKFSPLQALPPGAEGRRFWRLALWGTAGGTMLSLFPLMGWFQLVPLRSFWIPVGINGFVFIGLATSFYLAYRNLWDASDEEEEGRKRHFIALWDFIALGWISFFASFMLLLATVGILVRLPGRVWVYPLVVYLLIALGLWLGRREIPRASVEGPRDHPWVWVVRVFLSLSLGTCVLLTALVRIFLQVLERRNVTLTLLFGALLTFSLAPLFQGFAAWAWILAYLHYQKWRGVEELRL